MISDVIHTDTIRIVEAALEVIDDMAILEGLLDIILVLVPVPVRVLDLLDIDTDIEIRVRSLRVEVLAVDLLSEMRVLIEKEVVIHHLAVLIPDLHLEIHLEENEANHSVFLYFQQFFCLLKVLCVV